MSTQSMASALLLLLSLAGCDDTSQRCFEPEAGAPSTHTISACGELCEKEETKACVRQVEVANDRCFAQGDAAVCEWMCNHAPTGPSVYCAEHERLGKESER